MRAKCLLQCLIYSVHVHSVLDLTIIFHLEILFLLLVICFKKRRRASLVAQWLGILLPMQGTWVRALVWEDPTCHGATKPMHQNY